MSILRSQVRQELTIMARNGEQLLLLIGIPLLLLVFFSQTDFLPTGNQNAIDFLMPGVLALAIMSTAMVSLGIATGYERSYGVLKRLGTTPLGTKRLVTAKIIATCCIEIVQLTLLIIVGFLFGWNPTHIDYLKIFLILLIATSCFGGIGLTLAGRLRAEVNLAAQNGLYLLFMLFGGVVVSTDELPKQVDAVAQILPSALLSQILRDIFNNATLNLISVFGLCGWAVAACGIAAISFKWSD